LKGDSVLRKFGRRQAGLKNVLNNSSLVRSVSVMHCRFGGLHGYPYSIPQARATGAFRRVLNHASGRSMSTFRCSSMFGRQSQRSGSAIGGFNADYMRECATAATVASRDASRDVCHVETCLLLLVRFADVFSVSQASSMCRRVQNPV